MPITASAKKKMRGDKRRERANKPVRGRMRSAVKRARKDVGFESMRDAYSVLDKAAKRNIITKAKANRVKSRLVKASRSRVKKSVFAAK